MKTTGFLVCGLLVLTLVASAFVAPELFTTKESTYEDTFTLAHLVPNDAFLFIAEQYNPNRDFTRDYWGEVIDALMESGIDKDLVDFFWEIVGRNNPEMEAELGKAKEKAMMLVKGVDWEALAGKEMVFVEKMPVPQFLSQNAPPFMMPEMAWIFRGSPDGVNQNYQGLVAIMNALAEEVNQRVGAEILAVEHGKRLGVEVSTLNLSGHVPNGVFSMPLSLAIHDDMIIMGLREGLFDDVLDLLNGTSEKTALADDPRFLEAFSKLPMPDDTMTFFNMPEMIDPIINMVNNLINLKSSPNDIYRNTGMEAEVSDLNERALNAARQGDSAKALELMQEAYGREAGNSFILYNLACFNALAGHREEALDWLGKAVEGGFFAPAKISQDTDLRSLRDAPAFKAAVARARVLAQTYSAPDVALNSASEGEIFRLRMMARQAREEKDYELGINLIKQAHAISPDDAQVLYIMGCFHALMGHENEALDYVERSVDAGFYCPYHMSKDSDLDGLRDHDRYRTAMAKAREGACAEVGRTQGDWIGVAKQLLQRIAQAVTLMDYAATIERTEGYSTHMESIAMLVPDAKERPFYKVLANHPQMTDFHRYLPKETQSFTVTSGIDLEALYTYLEDTVRLIGPPGEEILGRWDAIQKQLEFDIHKDLLDWLDGDSVELTLADTGDSVMMIKVNDEQAAAAKLSAAIDFCRNKVSEIVRKEKALAGLIMLTTIRTTPVKHEDLPGFQNLHFAMSPKPAVWGVADGFLIFGSSADAVALCLATAKNDHPDIRNNVQTMAEAVLPEGPFSSVTFTDQRKLGQEIAEGLGMATMMTGMMGSFIPNPEVQPILSKVSMMLGKLTPVVSEIDFFKSSASCITFDGQAWHTRSVTHYFSPEERAGKGM